MTPAQLLNSLTKKFNVIEFIDLAECADDPTLAYRLFEKHHKSYYEPNERFVFYTKSPIGDRTIDYLRYLADLIDISRCFVAIYCSGHEQNLPEFDLDIVKLNVESREFDESRLPDVNTICALPWMHLEVMNRGNVKACCFIKKSISQSKDTLDLDQLFHGPEMSHLRKNLFSGVKIDECKSCWIRESKGIESLRQWRNKLHAKEFFSEKITSPKLVSLVLRPSTVCNFKCRICNASQSSQWAQEDLAHEKDPVALEKLYKIVDEGKWFEQDKEFSQLITDLIPRLEFFDLYGGEPLMTKQFKRLISESVRTGAAKKQRLHFNTNGSVFPENLLPLMNEFREVAISLSIDDIGARFETTRGGSWTEIEHNVDQFLMQPQERFKVSLMVTVSNLNVLYLDELIEWATRKKIPITFQILLHPVYLRFDHITQDLRQRVIDKFSKHPHDFLKKILAELSSDAPVDVDIWKENMKKLDLRRDQDLRQTHQELCDLMGYTND